jgi:hypothetical protein
MRLHTLKVFRSTYQQKLSLRPWKAAPFLPMSLVKATLPDREDEGLGDDDTARRVIL